MIGDAVCPFTGLAVDKLGRLAGPHKGSIALHHCQVRPDVRRNARLALQTIAFLLAFGVFSAVYFARLRTL